MDSTGHMSKPYPYMPPVNLKRIQQQSNKIGFGGVCVCVCAWCHYSRLQILLGNQYKYIRYDFKLHRKIYLHGICVNNGVY
jgi:hypothetical protein